MFGAKQLHHSLPRLCAPLRGLKYTPVSLSVIHCTAVRSFPRITRLWIVLSLCSSDSSLRAAVSYCAHVRRVSSTNTLWRPASQASSRFSIRRRISWYAVTCRACFRIIVWKTINRSEFHYLSRTPLRSPTSSSKKRLPAFPLVAS